MVPVLVRLDVEAPAGASLGGAGGGTAVHEAVWSGGLAPWPVEALAGGPARLGEMPVATGKTKPPFGLIGSLSGPVVILNRDPRFLEERRSVLGNGGPVRLKLESGELLA